MLNDSPPQPGDTTKKNLISRILKKWKDSFPSFSQWKKLLSVLSVKERIFLAASAVTFLVSLTFLVQAAYVMNTKEVPDRGGKITEGIIGYPRAINAVAADSNDADRDLLQLLYAGLFTYDEQGNLVPELAETYNVKGEENIIELTLKENLKWSDGTPLTADDIVFTIQAIQNPQLKSPIRRNWVGVETEKVSNLRVRFTLREAYAPFLERLTIKPLPAHVWKDGSPESFYLPSLANLKPVGSGPYIVKEVSQNKATGIVDQMILEPNPRYHGSTPYISTMVVKFFGNQDELQKAVKRKRVSSFALSPLESSAPLSDSVKTHLFYLPRYFAIFFNLESPEETGIVKSKKIRKALQLALDREILVQSVFGANGKVVQSPLLPTIFGLEMPNNIPSRDTITAIALLQEEGFIQREGKIVKLPPLSRKFQSELRQGSQGAEVHLLQECLAKDKDVYPDGIVSGVFGVNTKAAVIRFQEKYREEILTPAGFTTGTGVVSSATRNKLNAVCFEAEGAANPLLIELSVPAEPSLEAAAKEIERQWEEFGITVEIHTYSPEEMITEIIPSRSYQTLLFGEILARVPDPLPFWHSSQKADPGFNLSSYQNSQADKLLEQARKLATAEERNQKLQELQAILLEDIPAIALYDTYYPYVTPENIHGINVKILADPSYRFSGIEKWHIQTKRVPK